MKRLNFLIVMIMALGMNSSCSAQSEKKDQHQQLSEAKDVEVFYFHYTRRCETCQAVEMETNKAIVELYGEQVHFAGLNLDEPEGTKKAKELGVNGQTLLIVSGDTKINITNEGFLYARSNPDKLKQIISDKITPLL
jgi:hypothetical protein